MLEWCEQFETGDAELDRQHRLMVAYVNRIDMIARNGHMTSEDFAYLKHFVEFLEDFFEQHFREEEACLLRHECPVYPVARNMHQDFIAFHRRFLERLNQERMHLGLIHDLKEFCTLWIKDHFTKTDSQLKHCLAAARQAEGKN